MTPFPPCPNTAVLLAKVRPEFTFEDLRTISRNYGTGAEPTEDADGNWFVEVMFNGTPTTCHARRVGGVA